MNACIFETLRISPPIIRLERVCEKDWHHEPTGLEIKKGVIVQVSNYAMHFNEKYFPEPETFRPERFLPENKDKLVPYTFSAFGHGPHNCIGARFAKEEIQMAVVSILKDFRFELSKDSHLQMLPGRIFLTNFEPFHLKICKRV
jgi:cytochrome P450